MSSVLSSAERRRYRRYERPMTLSLYGDGPKALDEISGIRDVSAGGLGFETVACLRPGDVFRFRLVLPDARVISGEAKTRWVSPVNSGLSFACGAEFQALAGAHARALRRHLEPPAAGWSRVFDLLLTAAAAAVAAAVLRDALAQHPQFLIDWGSRLRESTEWLPQAAVAAAALAGIGAVLKRGA